MSSVHRYRSYKGGPSICKNNNEKNWDDRIEELHAFLQGTLPEGVIMKRPPKLTPKMAMAIIWFLQEKTEVLPDHYEMCCQCKDIFDSYSGGNYDENTGKHHCENCRTD